MVAAAKPLSRCSSGMEVEEKEVDSGSSSITRLRSTRRAAAKAATLGRLDSAFGTIRSMEAELLQFREVAGNPDLALVPIDKCLVGRVLALLPCLKAQHIASARSSSGLVEPSVHVRGNAAKHHFKAGLDFGTVTAAEARRAMRGSRKVEAIAKGSGEAASVVDAVFAEADHAAGSSLVGAESAIAWAEDEGFVEASSQVSVLAELVTRKMEILEHTLMARIQVIEANLKEKISQLMKLAVGHHQDIKTLREAMAEDDEEDDEEEEQG